MGQDLENKTGKTIPLWKGPLGIKSGQEDLMEIYSDSIVGSLSQIFSAELKDFKVPFCLARHLRSTQCQFIFMFSF